MEWEKPNDTYAFLRCTNIKHAKDLIDKGTVMFNCAKTWAEMEKEKGQGRGDLYEGVFAVCEITDIKSVLSYCKKYDDVECDIKNKLIYFRRKSVMQLPAYCFFMLKQSLFKCSGKEGAQILTADIPSKYFQDFADGMTKDQIMKLPEIKRPSVVVIKDMDKFIDMIKKKLVSMGAKESEILIQSVNYDINKYEPLEVIWNSPHELFLKDKSFIHQAECRIVVNTKNKLLIDSLVQKPFDIGSIKEFAHQINTYFEGGMLVEMTANVYQVDNE